MFVQIWSKTPSMKASFHLLSRLKTSNENIHDEIDRLVFHKLGIIIIYTKLAKCFSDRIFSEMAFQQTHSEIYKNTDKFGISSRLQITMHKLLMQET